MHVLTLGLLSKVIIEYVFLLIKLFFFLSTKHLVIGPIFLI